MNTVPTTGLRPIQPHQRLSDKSNIKHFGGVSPNGFPLTLGRAWLPRENQQDTEFCTAYATSKARAYATGTDMSPEFQVAVEGEYAGSPITGGLDAHTAMNAARVNGSLPKQLSPFTLADQGPDFIADWTKWPANLFPIARPYAPKSPYAVGNGTGDMFDNIRGALYTAYVAGENDPVMAFGNWYAEWNQAAGDPTRKAQMPVPTMPRISLHAYLFIDWITLADTPYLVGHLSQGDVGFGDRGILYFSRETVNKAWANRLVDGTGLYIWRKNAPTNWADIIVDFLNRLRAIGARLTA